MDEGYEYFFGLRLVADHIVKSPLFAGFLLRCSYNLCQKRAPTKWRLHIAIGEPVAFMYPDWSYRLYIVVFGYLLDFLIEAFC